MKMKILKLGGDRLDAKTVGFYVKLECSKEDAEVLRAFEGVEVDVSIEPRLKFQIGDPVHYSSVIGEPPTLRDTFVKDGPFIVGGTLCWKVEGMVGVVAQDALTPALAKAAG